MLSTHAGAVPKRFAYAVAFVLIALGLALGGFGDASADPAPILIGTAYTHWENASCDADGTGIIATYNQSGVRRRVRWQLAAMRAAGIDSLRLLLWHMTDITGQSWGVVPSGGGTLGEPYRTNLINYLEDVRAADFQSLTVDFGPEGSNDPITSTSYDPGRFDENWSFIHDVRPLVKEYGPPLTRIDLLSEGAPSSYFSPAKLLQVEDYITRMYRLYVDAFGNSDVTVSAIAPPEPNASISQPEGSHRLQNLIDAFAASGRGQPTFFSVHVSTWWHPSAQNTLYGLRQVDATLTANGLSQPLIVSETTYNDPELASAIEEFRQTSSRPVLEVQEWPLRRGSSCSAFSVSAPLQADAYINVLTGAPPSSTLTASVSNSGATAVLLTPYGDHATALEIGTYQLVVTDRSARAGFHLVGPGVNRATGSRFRGTVHWSIHLRDGSYRFWAGKPLRNRQRSFVALTPG